MKARHIIVSAILLFAGCYTNPNDVGRQPKEGSFESKREKQEELIRRQQEVIKRQNEEKQNLERQLYYDDKYREFDPHE